MTKADDLALGRLYAAHVVDNFDPTRTTALADALLKTTRDSFAGTETKHPDCDLLVALIAQVAAQLIKLPPDQCQSAIYGVSHILSVLLDEAASRLDAREAN